MQDYEISSEDEASLTEHEMRLAQVKEYIRLILKRVVAFIAFGPGVLGFLWLMSRILRR